MKRGRLLLRIAAPFLIFIVVTLVFTSAAFWMTHTLIRHLEGVNAWLGSMNPERREYIQLLATTLISFLLLAVAGRMAAWIGGRFFEHPIKQLIETIRQVSRGDFNIRKPLKRKLQGEFGELSDSIYDMAEELKEMERIRQEFISNVSHEIQSPLTSIRGYSRALKMNPGMEPSEQSRILDIIETESLRLSRLSDNLLKLTSLESVHHPHEPKPLRLDRQLRRLILACEPQWSGKGIELDVALDEVSVTADEDSLSQVWVNLLHNAVKFTPEGGTIAVALTEKEREVEVRIADSGIGIDGEDLPHLFERFYKADKSRNRTGTGSGLGLSIVRKIIELHSGQVTVRSVPGEGSEFTVRLPKPDGPKA
ncbi:sensor histidine kinase [Paenibacillus beijingensis]|uniref:histidine kinase n=1 Tax=Paenibacillus beijingensis TaxID=1126833 RepID=A0A0D5NM17_9BACL|nr:HAMP domain-containing sensor histidine kinase [Paenibacillus beijingensis]AJY76301.1 hypothetical protein VN24_19195 [Paenibacillus beijingensis]